MNNLSNDLKFQQQLQELEEDEDINLLEYIYVLYRYIFLILFCVLIGLFGAYHYNKTLPLFYASRTTFLIPGESSGNSEGGGLAKLMGVSGGGAGGTSGFIFMAMETDRLKNKIAAKFQNYYQTKDLTYIKNQLNLSNLSISSTPSGIFILSFKSQNPEIILNVINSVFDSLQELNLELQIITRKDMIIPLDPPKAPEPVPVEKSKNILFGGVGGAILGIILSFLIDFIRKNLARSKS